MRTAKAALWFTPKGKWRVDLVALKREINQGTLQDRQRAFIEQILPGFCDFAAGKIKSWPPRKENAA
jgi:hypothetical protein